MIQSRRIRLGALAGLTAVLLGGGSATADTKALYKQLADQLSHALVTVKFVLKVQGPSGPQEIEREFTALMIEKNGLVLCSSVQLGTSRIFRARGGQVTPTDIKVLIGDDTEGVAARLLTNDPELDLSWVQIKKPDEKGYKFLDLSKSKVVTLGDRLLSARRMDKFFDRAIVLNEGLLGGITKKPRELLIPTASLEFGQTNIGMPVFSEDGSVVGVSVLQSPDPEDMDASSRGSADVLVLPVAEVVKATEKAKTTAPAADEEEDDASSDGDKSTTEPGKEDKSKSTHEESDE